MTEEVVTEAPKKKKLMSAVEESVMLWKHGTRPVDFTALHVLQTAQSDVASWQFNQAVKEERKTLRAQGNWVALKGVSVCRGYGFLHRHVNRAKGDYVALLQIALLECCSQHVAMSSRLSVVQLYEDHARLEEALRLAGGEPLPPPVVVA